MCASDTAFAAALIFCALGGIIVTEVFIEPSFAIHLTTLPPFQGL